MLYSNTLNMTVCLSVTPIGNNIHSLFDCLWEFGKESCKNVSFSCFIYFMAFCIRVTNAVMLKTFSWIWMFLFLLKFLNSFQICLNLLTQAWKHAWKHACILLAWILNMQWNRKFEAFEHRDKFSCLFSYKTLVQSKISFIHFCPPDTVQCKFQN